MIIINTKIIEEGNLVKYNSLYNLFTFFSFCYIYKYVT